jgi:hypothetical protein
MEVSYHFHVPAALTMNRSPNTDTTRQLISKADLYAVANRIPVRFWNRTNDHLVYTLVTTDYRLSYPGTCYVTEWKTENDLALRSLPGLKAEP